MNSFDFDLDIALVGGPRLFPWPDHSVEAVSKIFKQSKFKIGWVGGSALSAKGVIPIEPSGAYVIAQDHQKRTHRLRSRAVIIWRSHDPAPPPFLGSECGNWIFGKAFDRLRKDVSPAYPWRGPFVIWGSSFRAYRRAISLLELGLGPVTIIPTVPSWEVLRRRFLILGGQIVPGTVRELRPRPSGIAEVLLAQPNPMILQSRILEAQWLIVDGPFRDQLFYREWYPGSLIYEVHSNEEPDVLKNTLKVVASRILKSLGQNKETEDAQNAKKWIHQSRLYREENKTFQYSGKLLSGAELVRLKKFPGVPPEEKLGIKKASIECFETIACRACEASCPEKAIRLDPHSKLNVDACTGCGKCLTVCPASIPILLQQKSETSPVKLTINWRSPQIPKENELVDMVSRKGEYLGKGRVTGFENGLLETEISSHLMWEARGARLPKRGAENEFQSTQFAEDLKEERVEVFFNGEKRLLMNQITVSQALFETGHWRAEDGLYCQDGSCQRCVIQVEGVRKLACQTKVRKGMTLEFKKNSAKILDSPLVCPCLEIKLNELDLKYSLDSLVDLTKISQGCCRGAVCLSSLESLFAEKLYPLPKVVQRDFPWMEF